MGRPPFGRHVRKLREQKAAADSEFSLRKVAARVGISPTYLSRVETSDEDRLPSEAVLCRLAEELGQNRDALLGLAGRVHSRLLAKIKQRPEAFAALIESFDRLPTEEILSRAREVRDGDW